MFIVEASEKPQAPSGAACYGDAARSRHIPLLTELKKGSVGWRFYKHGAPNGAFADGENCEASGLRARHFRHVCLLGAAALGLGAVTQGGGSVMAGTADQSGARQDQVTTRRSLVQLASADALLRAGQLEAAKREYQNLATLSDAPEHHRWEARCRLEEIERRQAGLPPRDPQSSRVRLSPLPRAGQVLHVSPKGDDANPGTPDKPFASLEGARDAIRSLRKRAPIAEGGVLVVVHGGEYRVTQTFALAAEDSGTEQSPMVYRAAPGETPRFTGGVHLGGFKPVRDAQTLKRLPRESAGKVLELDLRTAGVTNLLPLVLGGYASGRGFRTHPAHEVFFNGKAMRLARGPNEGFLRIAEVAVKDGAKGYDRQGSKTGKFFYQGDLPRRWLAEPDLLLYGYWFWDWADSYERVAGIDPDKRLITLAEPYHTYGYSVGAPFYALNALSELDLPGEYYLDRHDLRLFLCPPSDPATATVDLSLFPGPMVRLEHVSHARFERLTWELGCGDGIIVAGGANCLFAGCVVRHLAGNGIEFHGGRQHGLLSCDIYSLGRGGTVISGGDRRTLTRGEHFVENCDIYDLSRIDHTYTPAVLLEGVGNRLAHNRQHDVLSSAMRVEGNDHTIELNEVFNAVLESDDQGAVDMFGNPTYRGNVYRFNYWHHIGNWRMTGEQPKCGQAGIRLDDAICGTLIYGNIFERCSAGKLGFGGVQIHGGKDNIVDNNLFIDCAAAISFSPWDQKRWRDFVAPALSDKAIDKALYLGRYPALAWLAENPNANALYRNVAVRCGELFRRPPRNIQDLDNSMVAEGDSTLRPDNPLLNRPGFAPIPVQEIGLYADAFRKLPGQE